MKLCLAREFTYCHFRIFIYACRRVCDVRADFGLLVSLKFLFLKSCPILSTWHEWKNTFHNLYERTSCLNSTVGVVEWKMHLISLPGEGTKLSSRTSGQVVSTRQIELSSGKCISLVIIIVLQTKIRHKPREGTSALRTMYASFYKQRSDISHRKEQASYTLCMPRSIGTDPT